MSRRGTLYFICHKIAGRAQIQTFFLQIQTFFLHVKPTLKYFSHIHHDDAVNKPCFLHRALPSPLASLQTQHGSRMYRGRSQDVRKQSGWSRASPPWGLGGTHPLLPSGLQVDAASPCQAPKPSPRPAVPTCFQLKNIRLEH